MQGRCQDFSLHLHLNTFPETARGEEAPLPKVKDDEMTRHPSCFRHSFL